GWSAGDRLLDAGAGTGALTLDAAARGAQVTACEPVGALAALGRERSAGQPAVRWVEADLDDLPFDAGSFDHAVCAFGLTACVRPRAALAEIARVVAPGGTLVLGAWHPGGPIGRLLKLAERWDPSPAGTVSPLGATREERLRQDLDHHADRVEFSFAEVPLVFSDAQEAGDRLTRALAPVAAALSADAGPRRAQAVRSLAEAGDEAGGGLVLRAGFLVVVARRSELS
ncbi:MAG TPA: methyltransferase domain-containing protein, partial [Solirubrobacteraceae bacterium]|nr:methyltransferase domain-containing protein [Solirubrobacteraceae bacterium]